MEIKLVAMTAAALAAVTPGKGVFVLVTDAVPPKLYHGDEATQGGILIGPATASTVTVADSTTVDLTLTGQQISAAVIPGGIKLDDLGAPDDNTDLNVSSSKHGLAPKLSNVSTQFLNGIGGWTTPAGSGGGTDSGLVLTEASAIGGAMMATFTEATSF